MESSTPLLSIVLPMDGDPRGDPAHLKSWSRQKGLEPEDFEVVVGCCQADEEKMALMRSNLRENDTVFRLDAEKSRRTVSEMMLYKEGAARARGRYVFFSEDHVVAEQGCLAAVKKHVLAHPEAPGYFLGCGHMGHEPLAVYEGLIYDRALPLWQAPGCWDRVRIRATVLRRDVYESVGGMPSEYGLFGEAVLSARLFVTGHEIKHLPEARVRHRDTGTMSVMIEHVGDYVEGECRFHDESREEAVVNCLPKSDVMASRDLLHRHTARRVAVAIRETLRQTGDPAACPVLASLSARAKHTGWLGSWPQVWRAWLEIRLSYLRFLWASRDEASGLRKMEIFWNAIRKAAEARYYAGKTAPTGALENAAKTEGVFSAAEMTSRCGTGFYSLERTSEGRDVRWSSAVARLRLNIAPGNCHITLRTGGIRPDQREMVLGLFWNDHIITPDRISHSAHGLSFKVDRKHFHRDGPQELMIICEPMKSQADPRMLGLPIMELHFRPRNTKTAALPSRAKTSSVS